jgi:hypothetical protein
MLGQALSQMTSTENHPSYSPEGNRLIPCEFIPAQSKRKSLQTGRAPDTVNPQVNLFDMIFLQPVMKRVPSGEGCTVWGYSASSWGV